MQYEIVDIENLSGNQATIYSIIPVGEEETLFENFLREYQDDFKKQVNDILKRLFQIGHITGARSSFFKEHEGKPGDFVCALFDTPEKSLRLYCMRMGMGIVILGGGGEKDENTRAWQDDKKLSEEATGMIAYANDILKRIDNQEIYLSANGRELEGDL